MEFRFYLLTMILWSYCKGLLAENYILKIIIKIFSSVFPSDFKGRTHLFSLYFYFYFYFLVVHSEAHLHNQFSRVFMLSCRTAFFPINPGYCMHCLPHSILPLQRLFYFCLIFHIKFSPLLIFNSSD